jgi:phosphohistidine swiveling domain-containing protein
MSLLLKGLNGSHMIRSGDSYVVREKDLILGKMEESEIFMVENVDGEEVLIYKMSGYQVVVQNVSTMMRDVVGEKKMKMNIPVTVHVQNESGAVVGFYSVQYEKKNDKMSMNVVKKKLKRVMNEESDHLPSKKRKKLSHYNNERRNTLSKMDIVNICHNDENVIPSIQFSLEQKLEEMFNSNKSYKLEERESSLNEHIGSIVYPKEWEETSEPFSLIPLDSNGEEFKSISKKFIESCGKEAEVTSITKVQNKKLWFWYYLKRQEISSKLLNNEKTNEQWLFHGTAPENIHKIAKEGFDHRLSKSTSSIGQGVYFARGAKTSLGYLGNNQSTAKKMLLCRVTVGTSTPGMPGLRRPPINQETNQLYDSVYGYIRTSTTEIDLMHVIFDNYQSYPEYIINFNHNSTTKTVPINMPVYNGNLPVRCCLKCQIKQNNNGIMMHQSLQNGGSLMNQPNYMGNFGHLKLKSQN